MENYLTPGFRFYPTEEELVSFYLHNKLEDGRDDLKRVMDQIIPVLDIYDFNPKDLPQFAGEVCRSDREQWFFFVPRQENEARGGRPKRLTTTGYWKATGSPSLVYSSNHRSIGIKRTMVFYHGRAPTGTKTQWKMNEYKAIHVASGSSSSSSATTVLQLRQEFSLCRIYKRSKTLRSFDRRPQPQGVEMARSTATAQAATTKPPSFTNQPNPTTGVRRPEPQGVKMAQFTATAQAATTEPPSSTNQPNPTIGASLTAVAISSLDSSSLGDRRCESPRTTADINNELNVGTMEAAYEAPMWDWEQLNWF